MNHMIHPVRDDFFARLRKVQTARLPAKTARLAAHVAAHYLKVPIMSTRELAAAAGVSLATVVRFPRVLRYPDFDALRSSIQDRVNFDLTGLDRMKKVSETERSPSALLGRIIERDCESLRALAQTFSASDLEAFGTAILRASRVTVMGTRYVGPLASYFAYALGKIKPGVEALTQVDSTLYDRVRLMDPAADVVVAIAFPRYPADLMKLLDHTAARGVPILAITDSPLSPVIARARVTLLARASMLDFVGSLAAPAALVNLVVSDVGLRMGRAAIARLQHLEEAAAEAGTYVKSASDGNGGGHGALAWALPAKGVRATARKPAHKRRGDRRR
jgi:DNA-binding MurR/RpiR family transcriptional regulator